LHVWHPISTSSSKFHMGETNGGGVGGRWWHWLTHSLDLIDDDAYRCVQVQRQNKLCLVLKIWQSPTSKWEGCWALLLLSRIFFPPSPSCSIQFKIHEIHTCAIWWLLSLHKIYFISVFFFLGVTLSKFQHICQRKRTHILPTIFVDYNFCLPGVNFLSTLTSTWTINHASTSKWVNF
jgi:hypothetical protein